MKTNDSALNTRTSPKLLCLGKNKNKNIYILKIVKENRYFRLNGFSGLPSVNELCEQSLTTKYFRCCNLISFQRKLKNLIDLIFKRRFKPEQHRGVSWSEAEGEPHQDGRHDREGEGAQQSGPEARISLRLLTGGAHLFPPLGPTPSD